MIKLTIKILLLFCISLDLLAINESWKPPFAIPYPPIGITNTHWIYTNSGKLFDYGNGLVPYRVNSYGPYTHYIDRTAVGATDTSNPFGTPDKPRLTWPWPLPPGSAVQVHGNGYNFNNGGSSTMRIGGYGTSDNIIFFYGPSTNEFAGINRNNSVDVAGEWVIVENIELSNDARFNFRGTIIGTPFQNICIRNCRFIGTGTQGNPTAISTGGSSYSSPTAYSYNLVFFNNFMRSYGDWLATVENDACGFIVSQHATNIWVLDNEVFNMGGDAIRIGADQGDAPSGQRYFLGRNHFHDNRENGIDVKQARLSVISENKMHGFKSTSSSGGEAVVIHYDPEETWLFFNEISDCDNGIYCSGIGTNSYWIGNSLRNVRNRAMYPARGGGNYHLYNNTIVDCSQGIICSGIIDSLHLRNNIMVGITNYFVQISDSGVRSKSTLFYENYFNYGNSLSISWGSTYSSIASLISGTSVGDNSTQLDPLFVNPLSYNYNLSSNSPCINTGENVDILNQKFSEAFGHQLNYISYDGLWDKGAIQFKNTDTNPPVQLNKVSNLRISNL